MNSSNNNKRSSTTTTFTAHISVANLAPLLNPSSNSSSKAKLLSSSTQIQQQQQQQQLKKQQSSVEIGQKKSLSKRKSKLSPATSKSSQLRLFRTNMDRSSEFFSNSESSDKQVKLPSFYCVNIGREGSRFMDIVSQIGEESNDDSSTLAGQLRKAECKLRPVSGMRNHLNRNHSAQVFHTRGHNLIVETDLVERIIRLAASLRRLDLSHNNMTAYPTQLCSLYMLESLNLSANRLGGGGDLDLSLPSEIEFLANLTEIVLDDNCFKRIPKSLSRCRKLTRLSIQNNALVDLKHIDPLKRLRTLVVENNSLTHLDDSIRTLERLEYLHAAHNSIHTIHFGMFKTHLNALRHVDLSCNKLQTVSAELFMLPHLECLNLSMNAINSLPIMHSAASMAVTTRSAAAAQIRAIPLYSLDLSGNLLPKFYDYLLRLATSVDLSSNRIRTLPKKTIAKMSDREVMSRVLKLDANPLIDPPLEVCQYGLKSIQEYFENESRQIQLNKGFKIILLGECKSGKTSLAYALEDFYTKSNQMEQCLNVDHDENYSSLYSANKSESKLIEIHEFYVNMSEGCVEHEDEARDKIAVTEPVKSMREVAAKRTKMSSSATHRQQRRPSSSRRPSTSSNLLRQKTGRLKKEIKEINAFSNAKLSIKNPVPRVAEFLETQTTTNVIKKQMLSVTIYDFNGSLTQYAHLFDTFLDKHALIIMCVDASRLEDENSNAYLCNLLDMMILKTSKTTSFCVLPVLTKCDLVSSSRHAGLCDLLKSRLDHHLSVTRLGAIRDELHKIESQSQISASQSDRLKQLAVTQSTLSSFNIVYKNSLPLVVSSVKMLGVDHLGNFIKDFVTSSSKPTIFANVNKKVPAFWIEVENYACNKLIDLSVENHETEATVSTKVKWNSQQQQSINMFCIDYNEYKEYIVEKYGMSHLIEQITKYMSASGRILWYHESERLKRNVFLRPGLVFDMLFVLFRTRFMENFEDAHLHALRLKLVRDSVDTSEAHLRALCEKLLNKGHCEIDLFKLIWYPILITDSSTILKKILLVIMTHFQIGYPVISKEKLKTLIHHSRSVGTGTLPLPHRKSIHSSLLQEFDSILEQINAVVVPFYLPLTSDSTPIEKARSRLRDEWTQAAQTAVTIGLKKEIPKQMCKLVHKYTFPWGLMSGVVESFAVNCLFNSDLYYVSHFKNFIYAYNEDNSIGVIILTNFKSHEVIFEFYLISYDQIFESLEESGKIREQNFMQTTSMDLDQVWILALRVLNLFEETLLSLFPSLRYDRWSQCPECEHFSFMGEWLTPKELQKLKCKLCSNCSKPIDYSYLVNSSSCKNLALDMKKIHQRLENIARMHEARLQSTLKQN